jgi:hypothetical protein
LLARPESAGCVAERVFCPLNDERKRVVRRNS